MRNININNYNYQISATPGTWYVAFIKSTVRFSMD